MDDEQDDHYFIVGIDFGTTFSGVSYCYAGQPDTIDTITRWDMAANTIADTSKAPTQIYYGADDTPRGWGYSVPPGQEALKWFKLLLAKEENLPLKYRGCAHIKKARDTVTALGKDPVEVIADYLRLLWKHTIQDMERTQGREEVNGTPFKVWITIPAIWDDSARRKMLSAAKKAGIMNKRDAGRTTVDFVAEPEAAAVAVLDDFRMRRDTKIGDVFVVCDAGGGTVDIISYEVVATRPIRVKECVKGDGGMCGATFVDEAFINMLKLSLNEKRWSRLSSDDIASMIDRDWENGIKRIYDDRDPDRVWPVTVPVAAWESKNYLQKKHKYDDDKGEIPLKAGKLQFDRGNIRDVFEEVFPKIRTLIHDQIKAVETKCDGRRPKALLLVGGFGSSNYLYQTLQSVYEKNGPSIMQPQGARAWTAICRGAVLRGLSENEVQARHPAVVSRVSRHNYGMKHTAHYDEKEHSEDERFWDRSEEEWKVSNRMAWYLHKGTDIGDRGKGEPLKHRWYRTYLQNPDVKVTKLMIYENDDDDPPKRLTDNTRPHVEISIEMTKPFEEWEEFTNSKGITYRNFHFVLEMASTGTSVDWKIYVDGEVAGEAKTFFED